MGDSVLEEKVQWFVVYAMAWCLHARRPEHPVFTALRKRYSDDDVASIVFGMMDALQHDATPYYDSVEPTNKLKGTNVLGSTETVPWQMALSDAITNVEGLSDIVVQEGRDFVFLPDADEEFREYMASIVEILRGTGFTGMPKPKGRVVDRRNR